MWNLRFEKSAQEAFLKLDKPTAKRIAKYMSGVCGLENPTARGKALTGSGLVGLWRYRVGDYRLICRMERDRLVIVMVTIGHRSSIYG